MSKNSSYNSGEQTMRNHLILTAMLWCAAVPATAQVSVAVGLPTVRIGINLPLYPELVPVPGYPVYYAPDVDSNYFFYDGMYWVYQDDGWYQSSWYNGPWQSVEPEIVPLFVLRVPVRYYRQPPLYFRTWQADAPPHWGDHWGTGWSQRRSGWDRWDRNSAPAPAPLPVYQRQYSGDKYPQAAQQPILQGKNYRYQPRDSVVREPNRTQRAPDLPSTTRPATPELQQDRSAAPRITQHSNAAPLGPQSTPIVPRVTTQRQRVEAPRPAPNQVPTPQQKADPPLSRPNQRAEQRAVQQPPKERNQEPAPQERKAPPEPRNSQQRGKEKDRDKADDRGDGGR
jgi:hypothetical protein